MLHGLDDLGFRQDQTAAVQLSGLLRHDLLVREALVRAHKDIVRRYIQHARGDDLLAVALGAVLLQREEIEQHLQPHALPHVGEREFFLSGLVVHDPDVELAAVLPAIHAVGRAGENKFVLAAADADRRQIGVVLVGELQLKVERAEVGAAQLLRRVEHDAPRCLRQTAEEIDEPGALFPKILQLRAHIFADVFVRQRGDGLVVRFGKAAALRHLARHVFQ